MEERITVFVDGQAVELYRGMRVKHALIALDQQLYQDALEGRIVVQDHRGFQLGLDGTVQSGVRISTRQKSPS